MLQEQRGEKRKKEFCLNIGLSKSTRIQTHTKNHKQLIQCANVIVQSSEVYLQQEALLLRNLKVPNRSKTDEFLEKAYVIYWQV